MPGENFEEDEGFSLICIIIAVSILVIAVIAGLVCWSQWAKWFPPKQEESLARMGDYVPILRKPKSMSYLDKLKGKLREYRYRFTPEMTKKNLAIGGGIGLAAAGSYVYHDAIAEKLPQSWLDTVGYKTEAMLRQEEMDRNFEPEWSWTSPSSCYVNPASWETSTLSNFGCMAMMLCVPGFLWHKVKDQKYAPSEIAVATIGSVTPVMIAFSLGNPWILLASAPALIWFSLLGTDPVGTRDDGTQIARYYGSDYLQESLGWIEGKYSEIMPDMLLPTSEGAQPRAAARSFMPPTGTDESLPGSMYKWVCDVGNSLLSCCAGDDVNNGRRRLLVKGVLWYPFAFLRVLSQAIGGCILCATS